MKKYSVLLLYPCYITGPDVIDTYLDSCEASDPEGAVGLIQDRCVEDSTHHGKSAINASEDLAVLMVCEGVIHDLWQR